MYVTRPLSMYRKSPSTLEADPPDSPHSGYLVITDEEADDQDLLCWGSFGCCGICQRKNVKNLPFAQDKIMTVVYESERRETTSTNVWFVPVPNQPLSANRYYVIRAKGRHRGKAYTCSRECDAMSCCFGDVPRDKRPRPLNPRDEYQQVKIHRHRNNEHGRGGFYAKSVALDGVPPKFLRRKGWTVRCSSLNRLRLSEALGLDAAARGRLPALGLGPSGPEEVGKWHVPSPFVAEKGVGPGRQMRESMFYTVTLERRWEEIFSAANSGGGGGGGGERSSVNVVAVVKRETVMVGGFEGVRGGGSGPMRWFRVYNPNGRRGVMSVGLSYAIVDKMSWVLEEGGWVCGGEKEVKVERVEERVGSWDRFCCYVLVESFLLRRLDGSLVFKSSFRHTHRLICKWE